MLIFQLFSLVRVSGSRAMRPVVVLLLVALTFLSVSAAATGGLEEMCKEKNPAVPCAKKISGGEWEQMGTSRCVKAFYLTQHLNFEDAEKACRTYGGHLVSIHSKQELDQVVCTMFKVSPERPPYWIGLNLTVRYEDYLVYDWTDGTQHDFSYFAYMQPDFRQQAEKCVEINYNYWGQWNDMYCAAPGGYVCALTV